ncbi:hypothetical protein PVAP13_5NG470800 [Panicum virgatum]|uniref:Uncharacterized protein n=1 Tax=Panicum virgatum TaxID=38727 RepID=A0A8T0S210_PANVG|nr:hypothetical protein PVAP13_5NG470800 [Panicum virgatum]
MKFEAGEGSSWMSAAAGRHHRTVQTVGHRLASNLLASSPPPQTSLASHPSLSCSVPSHTSSPNELLPQRLQSWRPLASCCRCSLGQLHWSRHPPMIDLVASNDKYSLQT